VLNLAFVKGIALIYFLLIGFLTIQPLLSMQIPQERTSCCSHKGCSDDCSKPKENPDCRNRPCNPFIACAYGNFFVMEPGEIVVSGLPFNKQKTFLHNDNRLAFNRSDCWHPPQV
jgi:hypothetical protein